GGGSAGSLPVGPSSTFRGRRRSRSLSRRLAGAGVRRGHGDRDGEPRGERPGLGRELLGAEATAGAERHYVARLLALYREQEASVHRQREPAEQSSLELLVVDRDVEHRRPPRSEPRIDAAEEGRRAERSRVIVGAVGV